MSISCPQCHAEVPDDVAFCPGCGRRMWVPDQPSASSAAARMPVVSMRANTPAVSIPVRPRDNLIAALAYVTFIPATIFVLIEPFKRNRFVRFHSFQSIFLGLATVLAAIALRVLYTLLALIPVAGQLLAWLSTGVALLGWVMLWLVLVVKALQGEILRLPWIGNLAEKA
jgi:uncharacterized membrane protein